MANVLIVAYLLIVLALIAVILLQRSEGGALGIGGGTSGFMTARGSANLLTRTTAILAALFFATAIGLTVLSELNRGSSSILDRAAQQPDATNGETQAPTSVLDQLNQLNGDAPATTTAPADTTTAPAAPANTDTPDLAVPQSAAPVENSTTTPAAPTDSTTAPADTAAPANDNAAPAASGQSDTDASAATPPAQQPAPAAGTGATTNQ